MMKKSLLVLLVVACVLTAMLFGGCTTKVDSETLAAVEAAKVEAGSADTIGDYKSVLIFDTFEKYSALNASSSTDSDDEEEQSYLSDNWTTYTAGSQGNGAFTLAEGEGVTIKTTDSNGYASMKRVIDVRPNSYYKLIYTYSTGDMSAVDGENSRGLWIGFDEDANFNDGNDESIVEELQKRALTTTTIYFHTNNVRQLTLSVNVGAEEYEVSTTATIYRLVLTNVSKATVTSGQNAGGFVKEVNYTVYDLSSSKNVVFVVFGALFTALIMYVAYILCVRYFAKRKANKVSSFANMLEEKKNLWMSFAFAALAAFFVRILPAVLVSAVGGAHETLSLGYQSDLLAKYASSMANSGGTVYFFKYNADAALEPLKLLLLALAGFMGKGFEAEVANLAATSFFIRLFAILADVGAVVLIFGMLKKHIGNVPALIMSLSYALIPAIFSFSAIWTSLTSVTILLMLLTFSFALKDNYIGTAVSYFAACMFSVNAIYFAPVIIAYSVRAFIKKGKGIKIAVASSTVAAFVLFWLLSLPFVYRDVADGNAMACFPRYYNSFIGSTVYSNNAFNFQTLLGNNLGEISSASLVIGIIFAVFALVLAVVAYLKSPNRLDLMLVASAFVLVVYEFGNRMSPEILLSVIPILYLYSLISKDKRVYFITATFAVLSFVNMAYVYGILPYTASSAPSIVYSDGLAYTFAAFQLIATLYFVYLVYDITIEQKTLVMRPMEVTWLALWGYRLKRVWAAIVAAAKAVALFFKTVFSKTPKEEA